MAFGRTFGQTVDAVAIELGRNNSPTAQKGYREKIRVLVERCYEELLDEHDWPQLQSTFTKMTQAGERFYDFPELAQFGKFYSPHVFQNTVPVPLSKGISLIDYGIFDPDNVRLDPVQKWDIRIGPSGVAQIEIWPTPASDNQRIMFTGQYGVGELVDDADVLLLDDILVRLWALMEQSEGEARRNFKTIQGKAQRRLQLQKSLFQPTSGFSLSGKDVQHRRGTPNTFIAVRGA